MFWNFETMFYNHSHLYVWIFVQIHQVILILLKKSRVPVFCWQYVVAKLVSNMGIYKHYFTSIPTRYAELWIFLSHETY